MYPLSIENTAPFKTHHELNSTVQYNDHQPHETYEEQDELEGLLADTVSQNAQGIQIGHMCTVAIPLLLFLSIGKKMTFKFS